MNENNTIQFNNAITKALTDFKRRLEQQRSFQIQHTLLRKLHEEIKKINYCNLKLLEDLSIAYEDFYLKLSESGRSYENLVEEKNLVDAYSAFEQFLFDCFCSLYTFFPKYLGTQVNINVADLFIDENIEHFKRNIIELKVKNFIQANNIVAVLNEFKKKFGISKKKDLISPEDIQVLYELYLVRNILIHNNGIVNYVYIKQVNKLLKKNVKYKFKKGDTVLNELKNLVQDIKSTSTKVCEQITKVLQEESNRLEEHHKNKVTIQPVVP
ncbi:MAG: hypothetical protein HC877_20095 [Thioploca sp.]|nr:hypothetical protein [Thioploca sp.]